MKIFWWQGGIHIEPESDVESEALLVALQNIHYERIKEVDRPQRGDTSKSGEGNGRDLLKYFDGLDQSVP